MLIIKNCDSEKRIVLINRKFPKVINVLLNEIVKKKEIKI